LSLRSGLLTTKSPKTLSQGQLTLSGLFKRLLPHLSTELGLSLGSALLVFKGLLLCLLLVLERLLAVARTKLGLGLCPPLLLLKRLLTHLSTKLRFGLGATLPVLKRLLLRLSTKLGLGLGAALLLLKRLPPHLSTKL
jgi:hypothetical protein